VALGNAQVANLLLLGAYIETTRVVSPEAIDRVLENRLAGRGREQLLTLNKRALREGMKAARDPA
jgi:2-oxoglutarate ferredoxin oxidoreductase subunit gamma